MEMSLIRVPDSLLKGEGKERGFFFGYSKSESLINKFEPGLKIKTRRISVE